MEAAKLFSASNLDVYRGNRLVLSNIELSLNEGEVVALVGPNGSGKTTLLESCAGMHRMTSGKVEWRDDNGEVRIVRDFEGRRKRLPPMGLTLQKDGICGDETVEERLSTALSISGCAPSSLDLNQMLSTWGLDHRAVDPTAQLSGGLRRRLAVLCGLSPAVMSSNPRVILLDEPSEGLDESARGLLVNWMRALAAQGNGILIATHDPEMIAASDRIVSILENGALSSETQDCLAFVGELPDSCPAIEPNPLASHLRWAFRMEVRNPIDTISRLLPALISLLLIHTFVDEKEILVSGNDFLSALILAPAFISVLVAPALIKRYAEADCGRWWSALLGPMHRISSSIIGASLILPLPLIYISWLILGDTASAETSQDVLESIWIIGLSLIDVAIAASAVHLLVADLHRSNAAAASLLLLVLVWPFIELTDALTIILNDGMTYGLGMEEPFTMILLASLTSLLIWLVAVFLPDN
tara:strand:+ start:131 stop:1546 length:1416 start_codon:yes stop_codon:yes gene_type:complete